MPFKIQRVPRGLNDLLSIFGGATPTELEDRVRATLEIMQLYGLQQRQTALATNAAAAEGAFVTIVPSLTQWSMLFFATTTVAVTATMTALVVNVVLQRGGATDMTLPVASSQFTQFGATVTGSVNVIYAPDTPLLLPPGTVISGSAPIIGTDATANVNIRAEFGILS